MQGYWFSGDTLRDGRPIPPIGEWLVHEGPIVPCESGLHASAHPFDALMYAPGPLLHRVDLEGDLIGHGDPIDKHVGSRRRITQTIDATEVLRGFARSCALDVGHLWDMPDIVREYLETGNDDIRAAACDTAWSARHPDVRDAARDAVRDAARDAAWDAAWVAAAAAEIDAAVAARVAAVAARAAARAAARDAAGDAAAAAAGDAAAAAAGDAAKHAQRQRFRVMVDDAFARKGDE